MSRNPCLFLAELLESATAVTSYVDDAAPSRMRDDRLFRSAVERELFLMGEAAKALPADWLARHPDVDWRGMMRMRDLLAHAYFHVDPEVLWEIAALRIPADLPRLRDALAAECGGARAGESTPS